MAYTILMYAILVYNSHVCHIWILWRLFDRALLQKRPRNSSILLTEANPYVYICHTWILLCSHIGVYKSHVCHMSILLFSHIDAYGSCFFYYTVPYVCVHHIVNNITVVRYGIHNSHLLSCIFTPVWASRFYCYRVATVSRIDKIIGHFCRIASLL